MTEACTSIAAVLPHSCSTLPPYVYLRLRSEALWVWRGGGAAVEVSVCEVGDVFAGGFDKSAGNGGVRKWVQDGPLPHSHSSPSCVLACAITRKPCALPTVARESRRRERTTSLLHDLPTDYLSITAHERYVMAATAATITAPPIRPSPANVRGSANTPAAGAGPALPAWSWHTADCQVHLHGCCSGRRQQQGCPANGRTHLRRGWCRTG